MYNLYRINLVLEVVFLVSGKGNFQPNKEDIRLSSCILIVSIAFNWMHTKYVYKKRNSFQKHPGSF